MRSPSDPASADRTTAARAPLCAHARRALGAALFPLAIGCADSSPPAGPLAQPTQPLSLPAPAPAFPPLARSAQIFVEDAAVYGASTYHGGLLVSRIVLYGDDRFGLQFSSPAWGFFEYGGRYASTGSGIAFDFDGSSIAGPWQATGTFSGVRLSIRYNDPMTQSDFADGVYVQVSGSP